MKALIGNIYDTRPEYHVFNRDKFIKFYIKILINKSLSFSKKKLYYQNDIIFLEFEKELNKIDISILIKSLSKKGKEFLEFEKELNKIYISRLIKSLSKK